MNKNLVNNIFKKSPHEDFEKRSEGKKVVFTNGCFDILHVGHLELLHVAKSHGDILVIGLNSDESVKLNKGNQRPIINEWNRSSALYLLPMVDYVFMFKEQTPMTLIEKIKPDVLVKGEDWKNSIIVGEEFVLNRGGEIIIVDLIPDISTSDIIKKCQSLNSS